MKCKIDKDLLTIKCLYFFEFSVVSSLIMYISPIMFEFGITASELAVIHFLCHISSFLMRSFVGFLADKFRKYKEMLIICSVSCITFIEILLAIPKNYQILNRTFPIGYFLVDNLPFSNNFTLCIANNSVISCWPSIINYCSFNTTPINVNLTSLVPTNLTCQNYQIYLYKQKENFNRSISNCSSIYEHCNENQINILTQNHNKSRFTWSLTFWLFVLLETLTDGLFSAIQTLTDAITFVTLDKDKSHKFGVTRVFGTTGVLVFSLITSLTLYGFDWLGKNSKIIGIKMMMAHSQYAPCFILCGIVFIGVIVSSCFLKSVSPIKRKPSDKSFVGLFRNVEISIFFIFAILGGFTMQVFTEYYFLIVLNMFHDLPKYFLGLLLATITISEMILMGTSALFLTYFNSEIWISIAFFVWAVKWFSYLFVTNYWFLILIALLYGPAFGVMLPCMMSHVSKIADKSTQARMQGFFSSSFFNVGGAMGSLYGGLMLENHGFRGIFISLSAISLFCGVIFYPLQRFIIPKCTKRTHYSTEEKENSSIELVKPEYYL